MRPEVGRIDRAMLEAAFSDRTRMVVLNTPLNPAGVITPDEDLTLLAEGRRAGEAWRFPAATATALERLDPRETFAIEFHFRDGSVATAKFEAGDFTAGRAFLAMGML